MPKAPTISKDAVVAAALAVIDEKGLDHFSLALIAEKLNVRVPSLYYYFKDKSELLGDVARFILLDAERTMPKTSGDWKHTLISTGLQVRKSLLRHPNAAPLLLMYPPRHVVLGGYERSLRFMEKMSIPVQHQLEILAGLDYIAWGSMLFEAASRAQGIPIFPRYDPIQFRALAAARGANPRDEEEMYVAACYRFLASFDADFMEGRQARSPQSLGKRPKGQVS
jgi:TetR/AcrR family tetracycline transcriptional repressor